MFMSDSSASCAIVAVRSDDIMLERLALVGFLSGDSGPTRESYRTDLRLFTGWLTYRQARLLEVQRTHIELYGRWLEERGRARASHADPRTTMRYDRARQSLDRHATYIVSTFVAGASR
jgi:Phage integrase, N-terminal SAM-like domain